MRIATTEEVRKVQLEILDLVADFCEKNKINYWLDCGTLIGAIRHKGYIPWDDDIDLGMLRSEYERFSEQFNNRDDQYYFMCAEKTPDAHYAHGKVLDTTTTLYEPDERGYKTCINIDIFVYDNVPDKRTAEKMQKKREFYRWCHGVKFSYKKPSGNFVRRMMVYAVRFVLGLFPEAFFVRKMAKNAQQYKNYETELIGSFTDYTNMICEKKLFNNFTTAEFEAKRYQVPCEYDKYLRVCYGDYMQLPPEEQRASHHSYVAYINE